MRRKRSEQKARAQKRLPVKRPLVERLLAKHLLAKHLLTNRQHVKNDSTSARATTRIDSHQARALIRFTHASAGFADQTAAHARRWPGNADQGHPRSTAYLVS